MAEQIFLSRRNLMTLLSKLDRAAAGDKTACTLVKFRIPTDPFVQTIDAIAVTAIEDADYYVGRGAGVMHPKDEVAIATHHYQCALDSIDVSRSDSKPSFNITSIDLGILMEGDGNLVLTGYEKGLDARSLFNIDQLDEKGVQLIIRIPDETYAISHSFWRGLMDHTLSHFENKAEAMTEIHVEGPQKFAMQFDGFVEGYFIRNSF